MPASPNLAYDLPSWILPQRFHLFERHVVHVFSKIFSMFFNVPESGLEL